MRLVVAEVLWNIENELELMKIVAETIRSKYHDAAAEPSPEHQQDAATVMSRAALRIMVDAETHLGVWGRTKKITADVLLK